LSACYDDEINEQHILRAQAITLPDHTAVSNARCGCPHLALRKAGVSYMRTKWTGELKSRYILQTTLMDDPFSLFSHQCIPWRTLYLSLWLSRHTVSVHSYSYPSDLLSKTISLS